MAEKKEEWIENEIHYMFMQERIFSWHNDIKGFFDSKLGKFRKNKNIFIKNGISDIMAIHQGRLIAIEVKKPSEMKFFDRDAETLSIEFAEAQYRIKNPKRYLHALEQRKFLDKIIEAGGVGFFASSVEQVKERLLENGINLVF